MATLMVFGSEDLDAGALVGAVIVGWILSVLEVEFAVC